VVAVLSTLVTISALHEGQTVLQGSGPTVDILFPETVILNKPNQKSLVAKHNLLQENCLVLYTRNICRKNTRFLSKQYNTNKAQQIESQK
jgi:hypothetical protein